MCDAKPDHVSIKTSTNLNQLWVRLWNKQKQEEKTRSFEQLLETYITLKKKKKTRINKILTEILVEVVIWKLFSYSYVQLHSISV